MKNIKSDIIDCIIDLEKTIDKGINNSNLYSINVGVGSFVYEAIGFEICEVISENVLNSIKTNEVYKIRY